MDASLRGFNLRVMKTRKTMINAAGILALFGFMSEASAICTFGSSGEPTLQQSFDNLFGAANAPDAVNDCLNDGTGPGLDGVWQSTGTSGATILLELAGFADSNTFGLYDPLNPGASLNVFTGALGPGATATLTFIQVTGGTQVTATLLGSSAPAISAVFRSEAFGFFLSTPEGITFRSQSSLNPGGVDRSYAYRGEGQYFISGRAQGTQFGFDDAILAYEDLLQDSDRDYQDFVVLIRGVEPIPLPAAGWLLLSGIAALGAARRRRVC